MTIVAGTDFSESSITAVRAAASVAKRLAMPLKLVHVLDLSEAKVGAEVGHDSVQAALRKRLDALAGELGTLFSIDVEPFVVRPGWGRVDSHLTQLAAEAEVDLLVVGTHKRAGIARLWQGAVSRGVLHGASMSVACIPPSPEASEWAG